MIDLDAYPPSQPRPPRPVPWRRLALGFCAVLLLLLGPAAVPEPGGSLRVVTTTGRGTPSWLLTEAVLYTVHRLGQDGTTYEVVARPLAPGAPEWTRRVISESGLPMVRARGDLLILEDEKTSLVTVLEAGTGTVRWTNPSYGSAAVAGAWIVLSDQDSMALMDLATGRTLWRKPSDLDIVAVDVMGGYLVVLDYEGRATTLSARTGELVGNAVVAEQEHDLRLKVIDGRAYVIGPGDVTALRLPGLARLWTVPLAEPGAVVTCGSLLCVRGAAGVTAVDAGSGDIRWRQVDWVDWTDGFPVTRDGRSLEADPETGEALLDLGSGLPVGGLLLRADRDAVWITELATGEIRGTVRDAIPVGCAVVGAHLACPTMNLDVTVWRLREPRGA